MKKTFALLLAVLMVVGLFAGCQDTTPTDPQGSNPGTTPSVPTGPATYTYNYAMSEFPSTWNPNTYQTATDAEILDYISDGFYRFDYNETMDGYNMVPGMADGELVDVTADYVGQFGIYDGDTSKAYKITLRQDLKWQNGDPINAQSFVESAKRLLDPLAQNHRADSMYSGNVSIVGAKSYLKQGTYDKSTAMISPAYGDDEYTAIADLAKNEDGTLKVDGLGDVWFNYDSTSSWSSNNSLHDHVGAGYLDAAPAVKEAYLTKIVEAADEDGWIAVTEEIANLMCEIVAVLHGAPSAADYAAAAGDYAYLEWEEFCYIGMTMPEFAWENVGWLAVSEYELVFIMEKPLSGFYLKYGLPAPLVHVPTYDACAKVDENGIYTNTYCTSVETTMSYGPYKLTSFQADKQFILEKNDQYYGLTEDTYQTTHIVCDMVKEASTRHELFLQGKLDSFGLDIEYMPIYQMSDHTYYSTGDSTFAIALNPDLAALEEQQKAAGENKNKTILTILEFRQAISFALDRNAFCLATSPMNAPGFGLYSGLIVSDPEAGTTYRSTQQAKEVLANFWGVGDQYGEGKLYADIDEAIESITGYNLEKARECFDIAYDKAIAAGLMDADDVVEIKIGIPNSESKFYSKGNEFLVNNYTEAVKGTKLEGKLTFTLDDTIGNGFSDALRNNTVDMLFGVGWTGSALDPYGLIEAYLAPNYQYDDSVDFTKIDCTVNIDGLDYTTDCVSWYVIMSGQGITITSDDESKTLENFACGTDGDPDVRLSILAALEGAVLMNYNFIPIMDDAGASVKGMQIQYKTEEYIFGMGFGGIRYYTYNYSDAEWEAFVAENNGELDYT